MTSRVVSTTTNVSPGAVSVIHNSPVPIDTGAFGSSDPYSNPPKTPAPQTSASAATAHGPAQPNTTARVLKHPVPCFLLD